MTGRASIEAGPREEAEPGEPPADHAPVAGGEPVVAAEEQPAAVSEPEEATELDEEVEPDEAVAVTAPDEPETDAGMDIPAVAPASAPGIPVPASSMDSLTLPERSRHDADARRQRRRRSVAQLPALVSPVDIPEDAEGRIEFVVVRGGADRDEPPPGESSPADKPEDRVRRLLTLRSGWVVVAVLAAGLVAVFVVVSLLYR